MNEFLQEQKELIEEYFQRLNQISESDAAIKLNDKWSKKEIIGHLIDSASVNHERFIRAQFKDDLIFPGYNQDKWVEVQNYQNANWGSLIELWKNFNLMLLNSIDNIPEIILMTKRENHNLNEIAWKTIDKKSPASLDYLIKDYFGHMYHHINKIFSD
ncbi:MAG: hypothetical protein N2321_12110 [Melioribacteraceae bacterium]|nr:hypothetical protein [Melioribacteraceae bacterium]